MDDGPILICYDGSDGAKHAVEAAASLLSERRAVVLDVAPLLTFGESAGTVAGPMPVDFEKLNKEAALGQANEGMTIAGEAGFTAEARAEQGSETWESVVRVGDEIGAAAIVVAGSGLSGLREQLKGKVPRTVAEHAGRPVLLVPPPRAKTNDGPILICYDDSGDKPAIQAAASLLSERRAVVVDVTWFQIGADFVGSKEETLERASEGAEIAREAGFTAEARVGIGAPVWEGVVSVADETDAIAIVIVGSGLSGLAELTKGTVPRTVAEHAGRPVLLVPPAQSSS